MYLFTLDCKGITASFRVPETHSFQQTLPLPPRTTIIGMMGAAMGLSAEEAQSFAENNNIRVGVCGRSKGTFRDLWNYRKVTTKAMDENAVKERLHYSILLREYLFEPSFTFYFGSEDLKSLEKIRSAFLSPVYTLTAGNSDDLIKICSLSAITIPDLVSVDSFEGTVLPGNHTRTWKPEIDFDILPIIETVHSPQVFSLPTRFIFQDIKRSVAEKKEFTFVTSPIHLQVPLEGYNVAGNNVVLL